MADPLGTPSLPDLDAMLGSRPSAGGGTGAPGPVPSQAAEPSRWFWLAVLGLALVLGFMSIRSHWVPNKWLFGDGSFYMNVVRGVLEDQSLRQESLHPHSWYDRDLGWNHNVDAAWSNIALGRNGEWWPKHPILMPLVAAPFVWAFGPLGSLIFQFLCYALMAVLAYRVASRVASRPAAAVAAAAFIATPWVADRVWGFNNDVFYTVLILGAVDAALAKKAHWAGLLLGIGVFAKATNVLYGPPLLLLFVFRKDWRGALRLCLFAAGPALVYLGLNWYLYGRPWWTGYDRILVREAGQLATHSHSTDFHFSAIGGGLKRVLFGGEGFLGKFPLFFPALIGLLLLTLRRWREGFVFAWCIAVPIVFHAPYGWYRLEFNLPQLALAVAPLAALLPPFAGPSVTGGAASRVRWGRLVPIALVVVLGVAGLGRRLFAAEPSYLERQLPRAQVFLGDVPCDYFNNQVERWECTTFDRGNDWHMTGRVLGRGLKFEGEPRKVLLLHPHPSGKARRLEYPEMPLSRTLAIQYGLSDGSRADATVHFTVRVDGQTVFEEDVGGRGLKTKEIDTSALEGRTARVSFEVTSAKPDYCLFGVAGGPLY